MKKLFTLGLGTGLLLVAISFTTSSAISRRGFTCCYEEKSQCIYEGELVVENKYYNGSGPCPLGLGF